MNDKVGRGEMVKLPYHDGRTEVRKQRRLEICIKMDTRTHAQKKRIRD